MSQPTGQPAAPAPTTGPSPAPAPGAPTTGPATPPAAPAAPAPTVPQAPPAAQPPATAPGQQPVYVPPGYMLVPQTGQAPAPTGPQYVPTVPLPQAPPAPQDPDRDVTKLPGWAQSMIGDLRSENAKRRVSERTAVVTQHGLSAAQQLGANPAALLGSLAWQQAAEQLDPAAADFPQRLTAAIQQIVAQSPWMASTPAPPPPPPPPGSSGGDFAGAGGAGTPITEEQLSKMTPAEIAQAHAEGKLRHLM